MKAVSAVVTFFNSFRHNCLNSLFFMLNDYAMFNYHSTQYQGLFRTVLEYSNFFRNSFWAVFPIPVLSAWVG